VPVGMNGTLPPEMNRFFLYPAQIRTQGFLNRKGLPTVVFKFGSAGILRAVICRRDGGAPTIHNVHAGMDTAQHKSARNTES